MELYQLEAFEALVAYKSFTRASEALHISQPAVTRQIALLEAEMKTRLFDRLGHGVQMTPAGEAFHRYTGLILRTVREAKEAVMEIGEGAGGRLTIGASDTLATYALPSLLRKFRESHPRVAIAVHTGVSARVTAMVREGEADFGLVTSEQFDRALLTTPLADYETCAVTPSSHPLASREAVSMAELAKGAPLILMEAGTNLRTYVDRLLSDAGVEGQVAMELDNVEAIKRMVEADLGLSLLPQVAVRSEVAAGRLAALKLLDVPRAKRHIALIYRRDKYLSAILQAFFQLLQTEIGGRASG